MLTNPELSRPGRERLLPAEGGRSGLIVAVGDDSGPSVVSGGRRFHGPGAFGLGWMGRGVGLAGRGECAEAGEAVEAVED